MMGLSLGLVEEALRHVGDVAGERALVGVGDQIEAGAGLAAAQLDGVDQSGEPPARA